MSGSLSRPAITIGVAYTDRRGQTVVRYFDDCFAARRFYVHKDRQHAAPRVVPAPVPSA
jgi:hypothetical protein